MRAQRSYIFSLLAACLLLSRCAQVVPLGGGPRDVTPPKLVEALPAEKSTDFKASVITLRFDEYVQLKDLSNQLIISPRPDPAPAIAADGKKIVITIEKNSLQPNTTYRIYFGTAIADMNESNPVRGFSYVFSTGPVIDSLSLSGTLTDAFTNQPAGEAIAALYAGDSHDSVLFREKPLYLARSDQSGAFRFEQLPPGRFRLAAFSDLNKNGVYDPVVERIGFLETLPEIHSDTTFNLRLFSEEPVKGFVRSLSSPQYGLGQIVLNRRSAVDLQPLASRDAGKLTLEAPGQVNDTVIFYYRNVKDTLKLLFRMLTPGRSDTLTLAVPRLPQPGKSARTFMTNLSSGKLVPGSSIVYRFNAWMDSSRTDTKRIRLTSREDTTVHLRPFTGRWKGVSSFELSGSLSPGKLYALQTDSGAFTDVHGLTNDSSKVFFRYQDEKEFGNLTLKLLFERKQAYLVQLVNQQGQLIAEQKLALSLSSSNSIQVNFPRVAPGAYIVKVIFDTNANGWWDTGDVMARRQPEQVFIHAKAVNVVADWDAEEEIFVKQEASAR